MRFPVSNLTKVALGGPGLTTAYVTSARHLLTDANLAALDGFEAALRAPGPIAATRLARLGMYRQTKAGTAALLAAAAAGRLRPIGPRQV